MVLEISHILFMVPKVRTFLVMVILIVGLTICPIQSMVYKISSVQFMIS
jgi:hypothetical protein